MCVIRNCILCVYLFESACVCEWFGQNLFYYIFILNWNYIMCVYLIRICILCVYLFQIACVWFRQSLFACVCKFFEII